MQTQFDNQTRIVALSNLEAMCQRVSGMCHRYEVTKVSRSRVHVTYSNPNEYGSEYPMTAIFPSYPSGNDTLNHQASPCVVLDIMRVVNDSWDGEGWQAFEVLLNCPTLYRCNETEWKTVEEINGNQSR